VLPSDKKRSLLTIVGVLNIIVSPVPVTEPSASIGQ